MTAPRDLVIAAQPLLNLADGLRGSTPDTEQLCSVHHLGSGATYVLTAGDVRALAAALRKLTRAELDPAEAERARIVGIAQEYAARLQRGHTPADPQFVAGSAIDVLIDYIQNRIIEKVGEEAARRGDVGIY